MSLLRNPRAKLPIRLERWSLRLQPYQFNIKLCSGIENPADYLLRAPISKGHIVSSQTERYVNFAVDLTVPKTMTLAEVAEVTDKDKVLSVIRLYISDDA